MLYKKNGYNMKPLSMPTKDGSIRVNFYMNKSPQPGDEECLCSICENSIPKEALPLLLWGLDGISMAIICDACTPKAFQFILKRSS